jgi:hypothetical protein
MTDIERMSMAIHTAHDCLPTAAEATEVFARMRESVFVGINECAEITDEVWESIDTGSTIEPVG